MNKWTVHSVVALLVCACNVAVAESPPARILHCEGTMKTSGINAPSDVQTGDATTVTAIYTLKDNALIENDDGTHEIRYPLCRTTDTSYVFSDDCATNRNRYIGEWLKVSDQTSVDRFISQHQNTEFAMNIVVIDRVSLQVNGEQLDTQERTEVDRKKMKAWFKPYLISQQFVGSCQLATPKL